AFVEMAAPFGPALNISARTVKSRVSAISSGVNDGLGITGKGVNIAIMDSGVDDTVHEALQGKFVAGFNAITNMSENPDDTGLVTFKIVDPLGKEHDITVFHGTHVAGIALGRDFVASPD